jgi:hypothetical protein
MTDLFHHCQCTRPVRSLRSAFPPLRIPERAMYSSGFQPT